MDFDVLIIGSGPSGAQAASEAISHGVKVGLLDVGNSDEHYGNVTPDRPFTDLRANDSGQQHYFIGSESRGVSVEDQAGAHLTPARQFITRGVSRWLPVDSDNFSAVQSLAKGGLGAGWGAGCARYQDRELEAIGLPASEMGRWYEKVARDIGVSGPLNDDITDLVAQFTSKQPPLDLDTNAETLMANYRSARSQLNNDGFFLGQQALAVLTSPLGSRQANRYHDMDFWSDAGKSVWRPAFTVDALKSNPLFTYLPRRLVNRFREVEKDNVQVEVTHVDTHAGETFNARRLLLAAGAINSARIVLRSQNLYHLQVPILCNPYTYVPTINLKRLGRRPRDERHSLLQLSAIWQPSDQDGLPVAVQFYSYRSLLLNRLARDIPLPPRMGMLFSRALVDSLVIATINHAEFASRQRWMSLRKGFAKPDYLQISSHRSRREQKILQKRELSILRRLLKLKLLPLNRIRLPEGASIHYAGTMPFAQVSGSAPGTLSDGRLKGTQTTYVVDGSSWNALPAPGLTFTLMANARRVTAQVSRQLKEAIA